MDRSALVIVLALATLLLTMLWGWLSGREARSGLSRAKLDGPKPDTTEAREKSATRD